MCNLYDVVQMTLSNTWIRNKSKITFIKEIEASMFSYQLDEKLNIEIFMQLISWSSMVKTWQLSTTFPFSNS